MPELPEVETTVRALRPFLVGRTIVDVWNDWPRIMNLTLPELRFRLEGATITAVERRAKYLLVQLTGPDTLILHLKMSGHLSVVSPTRPRHKHDHTIFYLENGQELRFRDQRKFGRVYLVEDPQTVLAKLGPEPLAPSFTTETLKNQIHHRKRLMKPLLLDQTIIAGIGNIYADEALFYAGIHPQRMANTLTESEIEKLHHAIQKVLRLGIEREGASIDLYTKPDGTRGEMQNAVAVFRRTDQPCYTCGQHIVKIKLNGRSTHYCQTCQT